MKKLLIPLLIIASASTAGTQSNLETAILKSNIANVEANLKLVDTLNDQDRARLYDFANDILEKRNTKALLSTDVNDASNDSKRFTRSGLVVSIGLAILSGSMFACGVVTKTGLSSKKQGAVESGVALGLFGAAVGSVIALSGVSDFIKSLSVDTKEKRALSKKRFKKLTNAILVKQLLLKA